MNNKNNKQQQFIDWLCGKNVKFPFFRKMPKVSYPINYKKPQIEEDSKYDGEPIESDLYNHV